MKQGRRLTNSNYSVQKGQGQSGAVNTGWLDLVLRA